MLLALVAAQGGQRGSLWWASKHREHHKYAETDRDPHSPVTHPFAEAYATWFHKPANAACNLDDMPDFARYPELRWLDRFYLLPFYGGALLCFLAGHYGLLGSDIGGLGALLWGFYFPSCFVLHATSMVNTFAHMPDFPGGYRRYDVRDRSVNRPLLALFTLGSGFHNNHHRHAAAARAGFAVVRARPHLPPPVPAAGGRPHPRRQGHDPRRNPGRGRVEAAAVGAMNGAG